MNATDFYSHRGLVYDFIHPLVPGHRAIADLVLYTMQVGAGWGKGLWGPGRAAPGGSQRGRGERGRMKHPGPSPGRQP
jgi:hypothetical protein